LGQIALKGGGTRYSTTDEEDSLVIFLKKKTKHRSAEGGKVGRSGLGGAEKSLLLGGEIQGGLFPTNLSGLFWPEGRLAYQKPGFLRSKDAVRENSFSVEENQENLSGRL